MKRLEAFLTEIDRAWPKKPEARIELSLIGSGALMLQTTYERGTKDSDVFETLSLTPEIKRQLLLLAGPNTDIHKRHLMYIDVVANGIPFFPRPARWHSLVALNAALNVFEVRVLGVVDVVVSKLKRFHANDRSDIDAMIERGHVSHEQLIERFRSAFDEFAGDARAADLPEYIQNLNQVERDMLGAPETEFDLSSLKY